MAHDTSSRVRADKRVDQGKVISFGDMVAAAFDRAEVVTTDPELVATLATRTVGRWLGRTVRPDIARALQAQKPAKRIGRRPFSRAA
jgi:hypothetical protein